MTTRQAFFANLFIASPILIALLGAYHLVDEISKIPECTINAPREVPRCLPEQLDEKTLSSLQDADDAFYEACVKHEGKAARKPDIKYVVAMRVEQ